MRSYFAIYITYRYATISIDKSFLNKSFCLLIHLALLVNTPSSTFIYSASLSKSFDYQLRIRNDGADNVDGGRFCGENSADTIFYSIQVGWHS